jgi:hypothetical protein
MRALAMMAVANLLVLNAAAASAAVDPSPDRIGIYFDESASRQTLVAWPQSVQTIYIIVTNPTFPNIYGWQAAIRGLDAETITVFGTGIAGGAVVTGPDLQYDVTYETPLATQSVTVLASIFGIAHDAMRCSCLVVTGIDQPAIPEMLPLVWTAPEQPVVLQVARLYPNGVAAAINENPIPEEPGCWSGVALERTSWSTLKALFR